MNPTIQNNNTWIHKFKHASRFSASFDAKDIVGKISAVSLRSKPSEIFVFFIIFRNIIKMSKPLQTIYRWDSSNPNSVDVLSNFSDTSKQPVAIGNTSTKIPSYLSRNRVDLSLDFRYTIGEPKIIKLVNTV